jgi:hypothetical protein
MDLDKTGAADGSGNVKTRWAGGHRPASLGPFFGGDDFLITLFNMSPDQSTGPPHNLSPVPANRPGPGSGGIITGMEPILNPDVTIPRDFVLEATDGDTGQIRQIEPYPGAEKEARFIGVTKDNGDLLPDIEPNAREADGSSITPVRGSGKSRGTIPGSAPSKDLSPSGRVHGEKTKIDLPPLSTGIQPPESPGKNTEGNTGAYTESYTETYTEKYTEAQTKAHAPAQVEAHNRSVVEGADENPPATGEKNGSPVFRFDRRSETIEGEETLKNKTAPSKNLGQGLAETPTGPFRTMISNSDAPPHPTGLEPGRKAGEDTGELNRSVAQGLDENHPVPGRGEKKPVFPADDHPETMVRGEGPKKEAVLLSRPVRKELAANPIEKGLAEASAQPARKTPFKSEMPAQPTGIEIGKCAGEFAVAFNRSPADGAGEDHPGPDGDNKRFDLSVTRQPDTAGRAAATRMDAESPPKSIQNEIADQVVKKAAIHLKEGRSSFRIDLKPASMGHIRLQISTEANRVALRITAALPMVKEIIENNIGHLKTELQVHGLEIDEFGVAVSEDSDHYRDENRAPAMPRTADGSAARGKGAGASDDGIKKAGRGQNKTEGNSAIDYFA